MVGKSLEESNRSKYGDKSEDLIARTFKISREYGNLWCVNNALKYLERFIRPNSSKGAQLIDLVKAKDYIQRAIEAHPDYKPEEVITEKHG